MTIETPKRCSISYKFGEPAMELPGTPFVIASNSTLTDDYFYIRERNDDGTESHVTVVPANAAMFPEFSGTATVTLMHYGLAVQLEGVPDYYFTFDYDTRTGSVLASGEDDWTDPSANWKVP
jgi:hypothetical protein